MSRIARWRLALPVLLSAVAVAATVTSCSATSGTSSGGKAERAQAAAATTPAPASGAVPAVTGATDLKSKPTIAAGTPPAPTTLQTRDLVVGTGTAAVASNSVSVRYVGVNYADGKEFDSSWASQGTTPADFALASVVPGFAQGIVGMKVGGRREIVIPPALGYGSQANGPIAANETLVFVVDLVKIS